MTGSSAQTTALGYFKWAFIVTAAGLLLGGWLGWQSTGTIGGIDDGVLHLHRACRSGNLVVL